jgi:hypothetical protein
MSAGQAIVGSSLSSTVTAKLQGSPDSAAQTTIVVPTAKKVPEA